MATDIGEAIRSHLTADATVSGLVVARIYPDILPQSATLPAVVYHIIDSEVYQAITAFIGHERARLQFDCFASTRKAANSLCRAVQDALADIQQTSVCNVFVSGLSFPSGQRNTTETPQDGSDSWRYISSIDAFVNFDP